MSNTCIKCLEVQAKNPGLTARELSPTGSFEAVTIVHGNAYCKVHALQALKKNNSSPSDSLSRMEKNDE